MYQKQSRKWSCAHACIAMYKGIPESEVVEKFPYGGDNIIFRQMLAHYQIPVLELNPAFVLFIPGFKFVAMDMGNDTRHMCLVYTYKDGTIDLRDPIVGEQLGLHEKPLFGSVSEVLVIADEHLP